MNFTTTPDQEQILDALRALLGRHAGRERAMDMVRTGAYDHELDSHLVEGGFHELALTDGAGPLDAALSAIEVAKHLGVTAFGAMALVAPMVLGEASPRPVAMLSGPGISPVRMGGSARQLLILDRDEALVLETGPDDWQEVDNNRAGFALARLKPGLLSGARRLGLGSGETLKSWWRIEIAAQCAGLMRGALDLTTDYLRQRIQFDRPIASFQAVQHRLAHLAIVTEGARWLALEAAHGQGRPDLAATAAAFAVGNADHLFRECHQLHGAIGFTREYPLHLWTIRLLQLQQEMGGLRAHRRDAAELVFNAPSTLSRMVAPAV